MLAAAERRYRRSATSICHQIKRNRSEFGQNIKGILAARVALCSITAGRDGLAGRGVETELCTLRIRLDGMIRRMDEAKLKRFGKTVRDRRLELGLTQDDVTERGGPSDKRQTKIEKGQTPVPSVTTLRNLDVALEWELGSAAATLRGGSPTIAKKRQGMYTSREVERRVALELALARHGIDRAAARHHAPGPGGGLQLGAKTVDQLIEVLNSIPGPAEAPSSASDPDTDTAATADERDRSHGNTRPRRRRTADG